MAEDRRKRHANIRAGRRLVGLLRQMAPGRDELFYAPALLALKGSDLSVRLRRLDTGPKHAGFAICAVGKV